MSINWWIDTQNVLYPGNRVQFSNEKEQITEPYCDIMDEPQKHARWKKLKTKGLKYIVWFWLCEMSRICTDRDWLVVTWRRVRKQRLSINGHEGSYRFFYLLYGFSTFSTFCMLGAIPVTLLNLGDHFSCTCIFLTFFSFNILHTIYLARDFLLTDFFFMCHIFQYNCIS